MTSAETVLTEPASASMHPAGPAELLERSMPHGSPPRHQAFVQALATEIPARYTLELEGGTAVGDFGANVTRGGVLDYQTSAYFGIDGWREHPVFLRPRLPAVEDFAGTLLNLTSCGTSSNYYHFLFDVLPRYGTFEEALPGRVPDAVLVPHATRYQRELLALAGIDLPMLQPSPGRAVRADRLLVPSTPNRDLAAPRWVTRWLRDRLPPSPGRQRGGRLYLTRGDKPNTRRYVQESELWPSLESRGFVRLDPGTLSVQEQIDCFHAAEVIVAPHGAALSNLVFCQPGTRVLELFAHNYVHLGLWAISQSIEGICYHYLVAEGGRSRGASATGVLTDIRIPPARVLTAIDEMLA